MTDASVGAASLEGQPVARVKPGLGTKIAFGFGSVAYGVKDNGFNYFLLIFFSQVLGVDALMVGLALFLAFIFDAISDPIVGYWSDNTHSRWGRRHPFMYFAAVPVAVSYYFFWNPPTSLTTDQLFWYILFGAILVRTFITFYETPSSSLIPELSDDYDQRTQLATFREVFGWVGGTAIAIFTYQFLLVKKEGVEQGVFNVEGYGQYGLYAGGLIFLSIMISALGTHRYIPHLKLPPPKEKKTLGRIFGEIFETLANRSFGALFGATLLGATAAGIATALTQYINVFFWGFSTAQIGLITMTLFASAFIGLIITPIISKKFGKRRGAMTVGVIAFTMVPMPVALRLLDVLPANGDPRLFWMIFFFTIIDVGLIITTRALMTSMIADLVEQSELKTKRRSEGVFFSAVTFAKKCVQGGGVLAAGGLLTLIQFPVGLQPSQVPQEAIIRLGMFYAPTLFAIWMMMILCLRFYKINRADHEDNLRKLGRLTAE